jgi:hypothetical protein
MSYNKAIVTDLIHVIVTCDNYNLQIAAAKQQMGSTILTSAI